MPKNYETTFTAKLWKYQGVKAAWHFITLPEEDSQKLKIHNALTLRGWGSIKVTAQINESTWQTSIFPAKSTNSYILPIKATIRKAQKLQEGDELTVKLIN